MGLPSRESGLPEANGMPSGVADDGSCRRRLGDVVEDRSPESLPPELDLADQLAGDDVFDLVRAT